MPTEVEVLCSNCRRLEGHYVDRREYARISSSHARLLAALKDLYAHVEMLTPEDAPCWCSEAHAAGIKASHSIACGNMMQAFRRSQAALREAGSLIASEPIGKTPETFGFECSECGCLFAGNPPHFRTVRGTLGIDFDQPLCEKCGSRLPDPGSSS